MDDASLRGFREQQGKRFSDLELLAELQHNGAATCLIDFTTNSLTALWFACREKQDDTGKVVAMPTDKIELFSTVSYQDMKKLVEDFLHRDNKLWKWTPEHMSNRIVAQQSVFVFGRGKIEKIHYEEVMIDGGSKEEIRNELRERFGITEQHLFSDFTGFALSNTHDKPYTDYTADDHFNLGMKFHQRGDFQKALDAYDQAIKLNTQFIFAYHNRGITKHVLGDYQGATTDYNMAVKLNPKFAAAYYNRGLAKSSLFDIQGAISDYDSAIEYDPQYVEAYFSRGLAKHQLKDYQGAISDYDKVIELNPPIPRCLPQSENCQARNRG